MASQIFNHKRADYGLDAPVIVWGWGIAAGFSLLVWLLAYSLLTPLKPIIALELMSLSDGLAIFAFLMAATMLWSSRVGKLRDRDHLLDALTWRGDETVLDVGCGRGLLLIGAAKRLTTGQVTGVDDWSRAYGATNRPDATWENARREGVANRISLKDADVRHLPFDDETFDVVVSSLAIHSIPGQAGRKQALQEMVRVLKPGGQLGIIDIFRTSEYVAVLPECRMRHVQRSSLHPTFFFLNNRTITAEKPTLRVL